jgi:hypothetical protein
VQLPVDTINIQTTAEQGWRPHPAEHLIHVSDPISEIRPASGKNTAGAAAIADVGR